MESLEPRRQAQALDSVREREREREIQSDRDLLVCRGGVCGRTDGRLPYYLGASKAHSFPRRPSPSRSPRKRPNALSTISRSGSRRSSHSQQALLVSCDMSSADLPPAAAEPAPAPAPASISTQPGPGPSTSGKRHYVSQACVNCRSRRVSLLEVPSVGRVVRCSLLCRLVSGEVLRRTAVRQLHSQGVRLRL